MACIHDSFLQQSKQIRANWQLQIGCGLFLCGDFPKWNTNFASRQLWQAPAPPFDLGCRSTGDNRWFENEIMWLCLELKSPYEGRCCCKRYSLPKTVLYFEFVQKNWSSCHLYLNLHSRVVKSLFLFRSGALLLPLFLSPPQPVKRFEVKRVFPDIWRHLPLCSVAWYVVRGRVNKHRCATCVVWGCSTRAIAAKQTAISAATEKEPIQAGGDNERMVPVAL